MKRFTKGKWSEKSEFPAGFEPENPLSTKVVTQVKNATKKPQ